MGMIQYQHGIRTMVLDRSYIGLAHIATCAGNGRPLLGRQFLLEKQINRLTALSLAHPHNAVTLQIIYDGCEFPTFAIRYLVHPDATQTTYAVALPHTPRPPHTRHSGRIVTISHRRSQ